MFRRYNIEVTRDIEQGLEQLDAYLAAEAGRSNVIPLREAHF